MARRSAALSLLLPALIAVLGLTPATSAQAATPITSDQYESGVITATNAERAKANVRALAASSCVDRYAEAQAAAMAKKHIMAHQNMKTILTKCKLRMVGENVAYGYGSPERVTAAWMASPGHRANLLRAEFTVIGVGAVQDSRGVWYLSQVFGRP